MGTQITILEAIVISGLSLFTYVLVKTIYQHFKN